MSTYWSTCNFLRAVVAKDDSQVIQVFKTNRMTYYQSKIQNPQFEHSDSFGLPIKKY